MKFTRRNHPSEGEQELKFHVPRHASHAMRRWLDKVFQPHPKHAASLICSIYFDTGTRTSFREKEASDHLKTKYRLRWYADESGVPLDGPAYIEVKEKHGATRRKYRSELPVSALELASAPLTDPIFANLFRRCCPEGVGIPALELKPVLELRYQRYRYTHAVFPETFCLDSGIHCVRTHPGCLPPAHGVTLHHDVFEQKGQAQHARPVLQSLPRFGVRKAALSKYFLTIQQLQPDSEYA